MISWLTRLVSKRAREQYQHDQIVNEYREVATAIGDGRSGMGFGDCAIHVRRALVGIRDSELYHILDELEEAYANLGYRIISLQNWVDYGGWGVSIDHLWLVKRQKNERPRFTKFEPKEELPERSRLIEMVWKTGKAHEAYRDEHGDMQYRELE